MLSFIKVPPTTYVLHYQNGKIKHEGAGLSFFYWAPTSTIIAVPLASADVPFVFQETPLTSSPSPFKGNSPIVSQTLNAWHPCWISQSADQMPPIIRTLPVIAPNCPSVLCTLCRL